MCLQEVTYQATSRSRFLRHSLTALRGLARGQIAIATSVVVKTSGFWPGAFGAAYNEDSAPHTEILWQMLFFMGATLAEHKWLILRKRRGRVTSTAAIDRDDVFERLCNAIHRCF